ncbi:unnamed protein product [Cylindrotheca closterium]|uniref:U4/U6.U5 tri-snRNP-associated protein 1 n=1 Tax=Cylindrotheca closterium TaxID=2856 RepID=A0AAD2G9M6_9STRA|nr:unnamed protein product [Cylindrotheca closterium]
MPEEVIELSVEETNKLRAELGLAPLRLSREPVPFQSIEEQASRNEISESASKADEVLEMSIDETNKLRDKLGLKPLRSGSGKEVVHKPATNDGAAKEAAARISEARLQRDVQRGAAKTFGSQTLSDDADKSALSWAEKMRQQKDEAPKKSKTKKTTKTNERYDDNDLEGMQVSHKMSELEAGSTTVLTLADAPLLEKNESNKATGLNEAEDTLENDNLRDQKKQQDGLRKKRMLEMGMGRAGGYAGFDDEEFEELGGTLGPSRKERGNLFLGDNEDEDQPSRLGFRLGSTREKEEKITDFDAIQRGKAISLLPTKADVAASDYMTVEEEDAERAKRKLKKDGKFKKKKKKDKKSKKQRRRKMDSDDEEEKVEAPGTQNGNLLQHLEETASAEVTGMRKRRKVDEEESNDHIMTDGDVKEEAREKRARYDDIMDKGNERTRLAFQEKKKPKVEEDWFDEEPDDSFLNAALAKARRLNRLRELNKPKAKGADAVAAALKQSEDAAVKPDHAPSSSGISFSTDDTREFTRAIQARAQQEERSKTKPAPNTSGIKIEIKSAPKDIAPKVEDVEMKEAEEEENLDIHELAKEVDEDDTPALEGTASEAAGVGRGLSSFVSMLKQTGEIKKHAGKEELRGRAKDERNYENYEALDLKKVVKIGRNANDKDKEFAGREIKLEYRDKHGRLLTSKEAYRDLCYQFHGHAGSKKKEDKRLRQIQREQAEARMASKGTTAGTLGALKKTQKATGKAFIVHKT